MWIFDVQGVISRVFKTLLISWFTTICTVSFLVRCKRYVGSSFVNIHSSGKFTNLIFQTCWGVDHVEFVLCSAVGLFTNERAFQHRAEILLTVQWVFSFLSSIERPPACQQKTEKNLKNKKAYHWIFPIYCDRVTKFSSEGRYKALHVYSPFEVMCLQ